MWIYQKRLEFPVDIKNPNPRMAKALMAQYGGPDSELGAATRYLTQRFTMPDDRVKAIVNDIGTEEYAPISYRLLDVKNTALHIWNLCSAVSIIF